MLIGWLYKIDEFTTIRSHIAEGANKIVKTMVDRNERTKQSHTTDKLWSLFLNSSYLYACAKYFLNVTSANEP